MTLFLFMLAWNNGVRNAGCHYGGYMLAGTLTGDTAAEADVC